MNKLLTTRQAAEILGVSEQFLERARWAGTPAIPYIQVGDRAVRYNPDALRGYLDSRTYCSTSERPHKQAA